VEKIKETLGGGGRDGMPKPPYPLMLGQMLYTERTLCDVLPKLVEEASDPELKSALEAHLQQTRDHATKVEEIFGMLGAKPSAQTAPVMEGLKTVHKELSSGSPDMLGDLVVASAAASTEHFEISMYEALRAMSEALGRKDVCGVLDGILGQERHALQLASDALEKASKLHSSDLAA
jgi:ferritin-like metal-binding protein YciE